MLVSAVTESERTLGPGVDVVLEVVRMAVNEQFPSLMPTLYPGSMANWIRCGRRLATYQIIRVLPSTAIIFFFACFFVGNAVIRPVGIPARRSWARPGPRAVSDAFMADGVEQ